MIKRSLFFFFFPIILFSQNTVNINNLSNSINTFEAELNFVQYNDTLAYFTAIINTGDEYESAIYSVKRKQNNWNKKRYAKFNIEKQNIGNINFTKNNRIYVSTCDFKKNICGILEGDFTNKNKYKKISELNSKKNIYTQPHGATHENQEVLYFVSDKEGGFGGLDIWVCNVDKNGNVGVPINAGSRINSPADEITPFYNIYNNMLYFSSNRNNGMGKFDIYKSEGKQNLWKTPINVIELNSEEDETYISFYSENKGYFSSNRKGARYKYSEFCCNDIFSFEYETNKKNTSGFLRRIENYLPLKLYFHNDEPDCCTERKTTNKTYKDAYISYFKLEQKYLDISSNKEVEEFFSKTLKSSYNHLKLILDEIINELINEKKVIIYIKGYASPLYEKEYNINLSKRRIDSFINFLNEYKSKRLSDYIKSGMLEIHTTSFGESKASEKVSSDKKNKKKSIYSIEAMLERKIEIIKVMSK